LLSRNSECVSCSLKYCLVTLLMKLFCSYITIEHLSLHLDTSENMHLLEQVLYFCVPVNFPQSLVHSNKRSVISVK
jgi:hypothetical protein